MRFSIIGFNSIIAPFKLGNKILKPKLEILWGAWEAFWLFFLGGYNLYYPILPKRLGLSIPWFHSKKGTLLITMRQTTIEAMDWWETVWRLPNRKKIQRDCDHCLPFVPNPFSPFIINSLMNSKTILAVLLIAILLADSLNGARWQAMGSGMNNTVITEIWTGLEANISTTLSINTK